MKIFPLFFAQCQLVLLAVLMFAAGQAKAGPLLSDSNLFAALNLNYPGLEQVRTNAAAGNYAAAKTKLADYLRWRTNVTWYWDPHAVTNNVSYNKSSADQATNGYVSISGISYTFPNGDIDWFYNITKDTNNSYDDNNEWQWQLNRMYPWPNMGSTYWGTGNEAYAAFWVSQLRDWLTSCPVPSSSQNVAGSCWRTIESGLRMGSYWPNTYHRFLLSPSFTDQDICDYLKSCIEHARYLRKYPSSGNWLTMEMSGLYTVGALYPELNEAMDWRTNAVGRLYAEQTNQFYPDGPQKELAPGYHGVAIGNILAIYNVASLEGRLGELPTNYVSGLEKAYEHYLRLMAPDRKMPQFNDCISAADSKSSLTTGSSIFTNRSDFLWVASNGASGAPPAFESCTYPWAGYNVMRSGWATTDNYLCLDAGALGVGHWHQDKLNVVLWAWGQRMLFDSGGGEYETSIWRTYGTTTWSHNTVIVDGQNQAGGDGGMSYTDPDYATQTAQSWRWECDVVHDFATGTYNRGYGSYNTRPVTHTRRVLFVKPDLYLIADTISTNDASSHACEARWHLLPTNSVTDPLTKVVTTTQAGQPNLAIVPCLLSNITVAAVVARTNASASGLLGWNIIGGAVGYSPATTVTHQQSGIGTKQFLTLLMPLRTGETNPVTAVVSTGPASARIELADRRKLLVSADPNPLRGMRLVEILADNSTNRLAGGGYASPSISAITDQVTAPSTSVGPIAFTVGETNLPPASLVVVARSLDTRIVPNDGIVLSGNGSNRTVTVTPAPGRAGTAKLVLTVVDPDGATASASFNVVVTAPAAMSYFWDTSSASGLQAASGTWSGLNAAWSSTNSGSSPLLAWPVAGNDANFIGAGGIYDITVSATQNVNHLNFTNGNWTLGGGGLNHFAGPMNITVFSNATLNLPVTGDTDLVKLGTGVLALGARASYVGGTEIQRGTIRLMADEVMPPTTTVTLGSDNNAATLDIMQASQTLGGLVVVSTNSSTTNFITVGKGRVLGINGPVTVGTDIWTNSTTRLVLSGGGSLVAAGYGQDFTVGCSASVANAHGNSASLDLSRMGNVMLGTEASPLDELRVGYGNGSGSSTAILTLSDTNNVITASTMQIGNSTGANGTSGNLVLGAGTNVIVADTLNIGLCKVGGTVKFASQAANSPGTVIIGGKSRLAASIWIGFKNGTGTAANPSSNLDLRGHNSTVIADSLSIAIENGSGGGGESAALYFDTGLFTVTNVTIAAKSGSSTGAANGTLNIGGGVFTVFAGGTFTLASQEATGTANGTLNLTGGTLNCDTDILDGGRTNTSTITLNGGTLNLFGHRMGSTNPINVLNFQSGTLRDAGEINAGLAPLVKAGAGTLTLAGTNAYSGGTIVSNGTLVLDGNLASELIAVGGTLAGSGIVGGDFTLGSGAVLRSRINGTVPVADYDQITITGSNSVVTLAGSLALAVTNALPNGASFTLIRNNGSSPIAGSFNGLPQLAVFTNGTSVWRINYAGGDGNDVVLTVMNGGVNLPPFVTLVSPSNNAVVSAPLALLADAGDPNNDLDRVEFYGDDVLLGKVTNAPFALVWTNLSGGYHSVFARAVDSTGLAMQTPSASLSVNWPLYALVASGSIWKYHDLGQNLGTNWRKPEYDDSAWAAGPAPLGYGDASGLWPRTTNSFGPSTTKRYITTYYRRAFEAPDVPAWSNVSLAIQRDDGAVVYLNGVEVFRSNMPTGAVTYLTTASSQVSTTNETNWFYTSLSPSLLIAGPNVLAVEIHQNTNTSSDIWFDLALSAQPTNAFPKVAWLSADGSLTLTWPGWMGAARLQYATNMTPPVTWAPATNMATLVSNQWRVTIPALTNSQRYHRLQSP